MPVIDTAVTAELRNVALDPFKHTPTETVTMVTSTAQSHSQHYVASQISVKLRSDVPVYINMRTGF